MWPLFFFQGKVAGWSIWAFGEFLFYFGGFCGARVKEWTPPTPLWNSYELSRTWWEGTENIIEQENNFSNRRNTKQKTLKYLKEFCTFPTKMALTFKMLPKGRHRGIVAWLASGDWILKTPGQMYTWQGTENGSPGSKVPAGNMPCTPTVKWEQKSL